MRYLGQVEVADHPRIRYSGRWTTLQGNYWGADMRQKQPISHADGERLELKPSVGPLAQGSFQISGRFYALSVKPTDELFATCRG